MPTAYLIAKRPDTAVAEPNVRPGAVLSSKRAARRVVWVEPPDAPLQRKAHADPAREGEVQSGNVEKALSPEHSDLHATKLALGASGAAVSYMFYEGSIAGDWQA